MQVTQRIPTSQFAYIEFTADYESAEDALEENARLVKAYEEPGLPQNEWARVRNAMLVTGEFDPNIEGLSKAQRYWVNQTKLALRAHKDGQ